MIFLFFNSSTAASGHLLPWTVNDPPLRHSSDLNLTISDQRGIKSMRTTPEIRYGCSRKMGFSIEDVATFSFTDERSKGPKSNSFVIVSWALAARIVRIQVRFRHLNESWLASIDYQLSHLLWLMTSRTLLPVCILLKVITSTSTQPLSPQSSLTRPHVNIKPVVSQLNALRPGVKTQTPEILLYIQTAHKMGGIIKWGAFS